MLLPNGKWSNTSSKTCCEPGQQGFSLHTYSVINHTYQLILLRNSIYRFYERCSYFPQVGLPTPKVGLPPPQVGLPPPQVGLPPPQSLSVDAVHAVNVEDLTKSQTYIRREVIETLCITKYQFYQQYVCVPLIWLSPGEIRLYALVSYGPIAEEERGLVW